MKNILKSLMLLVTLFSVNAAYAHIGPNSQNTAKGEYKVSLRSDCSPGIAEIDQQINNVRARLSTGGDVWWNRQEGLYIVPKPAEGELPVSAIFAGGVWIGGRTLAGSTKLAGVTYRSLTDNFDWYPGPLDEDGVTEDETCRNWDRFFVVNGVENLRHVTAWEAAEGDYDCDSIPEGVRYWPGKGNPYWGERFDFPLPDQNLGSFWDENLDGIYDPCDGDFPAIEIRDCGAEDRKKAKELIPDEMIFWIYNDNGNAHRLTTGDAIQMEVQVQAFAYATNDEVNDMTFQRYKMVNRANEDLIDCYFAMWVDPDLGCFRDDYVGCDVGRSLAYTYNEDAIDGDNGVNCGAVPTYGFDIPIIGTDYFRGPRGPKVYLRDADGVVLEDSILVDPEPGTGDVDVIVELGMTSFVVTNNCSVGEPEPATCDPENTDDQFYNNLRGLWRTGEPITFGGTGFNPESTDTVRYMFPDAPNDNNGWSMCTAGLPMGDRRTLQATGPLLLQPGAENELIIGVVYVPDLDYPCPDISRLQAADDVAQALFDNCFDITDGPDAPDLCGVELDQEIILSLSNNNGSNNFEELYEEVDLRAPETVDNLYRFEGYKVYQLANASVSTQELDDVDKAQLIYQADLKNGVSEIFNWTSQVDPRNGQDIIWTFNRVVSGQDEGVDHSFRVTQDAFALGDPSLINHKPYHFLVLAYAYNNFEPFDINNPEVGQRTPYLEGRRNVRSYTFIPRPIVYTNLNASYGEGAVITRLQGEGTGSGFLDLQEGERERILESDFDGSLTYKKGAGPIDVQVINPLDIRDGRYNLKVVGEFDDGRFDCELVDGAMWQVTDLETNEVIASDRSIDEVNEQLINKKGFSIKMFKQEEAGTENSNAPSLSIEYADPDGPRWFNAVPDNGIEAAPFIDPVQTTGIDESGSLNSVGAGLFFPFAMANIRPAPQTEFLYSPAWLDQNGQAFLLNGSNTSPPRLQLKDLNNVDIVMTPNKDLWSRCVVVETSVPLLYNSGQSTLDDATRNFDRRTTPSVDKNGNPDNSGTTGYGWFPGYAVDVESGKRLNIFFGEATVFNETNGADLDVAGAAKDMIYNPTGQLFVDIENFGMVPSLGGLHNVYVTRQEYDGCEQFGAAIEAGSPISNTKFDYMSSITWTAMTFGNESAPLLSVEEGLIPNEVVFKLRVPNAYNLVKDNSDLDRIRRCDVYEGFPEYNFEFSGVSPQELVEEEYEGALSNANIVPNPYYGYSAYENSSLNNRVKITNLPQRAIVTIYTLDGKFIQQFNRDARTTVKSDPFAANSFTQESPALEWDLKNFKGIPVASGVYLIHISAPDLGEERTLKWFGVNRQFDPTGL